MFIEQLYFSTSTPLEFDSYSTMDSLPAQAPGLSNNFNIPFPEINSSSGTETETGSEDRFSNASHNNDLQAFEASLQELLSAAPHEPVRLDNGQLVYGVIGDLRGDSPLELLTNSQISVSKIYTDLSNSI